MTIELDDLVDSYIKGLLHELKRELNVEFEGSPVPMSIVGEKAETHVLQALAHECLLPLPPLLEYVGMNETLVEWYKTNDNIYADFFLEVLPATEPYIRDPFEYATIWGNLAVQIIGAIVGNIREAGTL